MTDRETPTRDPRTEAGRKLLAREALNGRSFGLIRVEDIVAIEDAAAVQMDEARLARAINRHDDGQGRHVIEHDCAVIIAAEYARLAASTDTPTGDANHE